MISPRQQVAVNTLYSRISLAMFSNLILKTQAATMHPGKD